MIPIVSTIEYKCPKDACLAWKSPLVPEVEILINET